MINFFSYFLTILKPILRLVLNHLFFVLYYIETINKIFNDLKILSKQLLKEPKSVMPYTNAPNENAFHQADLLFLPNDDGCKYL